MVGETMQKQMQHLWFLLDYMLTPMKKHLQLLILQLPGEFATAAVAHAAAEPATAIDAARARSSSEASSVSLRKPKAVKMAQLDISAAFQESLEVADDLPVCYK